MFATPFPAVSIQCKFDMSIYTHCVDRLEVSIVTNAIDASLLGCKLSYKKLIYKQ